MGVAEQPPRLDDQVQFYRRIHTSWIYCRPGLIRPNSGSFKDREHEVSLFRADMISADEVLADSPDHSLVTVTYAVIRDLDLDVIHRPADGGAAHYVIMPHPSSGAASRLAKAAEWVKYRGPTGKNAWLHMPRYP